MMKSKKKKSRQTAMEVADRLHSAAIHLLRQVRKQDVATREAPARLSALSVLVFGGSVTLGQLAAAEQVKPPTMTRIVTGLERSGLAERVDAAGANTRDSQRHATVAKGAAAADRKPGGTFEFAGGERIARPGEIRRDSRQRLARMEVRSETAFPYRADSEVRRLKI